MASSQSEDYDRLVPPQLMDEVNTTAHTQPALPPEAVSIMNHRFDHSVGQWGAELPQFCSQPWTVRQPSHFHQFHTKCGTGWWWLETQSLIMQILEGSLLLVSSVKSSQK